MSGAKGRSGRRRKATCARNGRVYVALDVANIVSVNGNVIRRNVHAMTWIVNGISYENYDDAAAEFVRRVNG